MGRAIVKYCVIGLALIGGASFVAIRTLAPDNPSDEEMAREFASNRIHFQQLLSMIQAEPHVTRVAPDFIWVDGVRSPTEAEQLTYLPNARWEKYRQIFRQLHLKYGVVKMEDGSIGFLRSGGGLAVSGWGKDFVWSKTSMNPTLVLHTRKPMEDDCRGRRGTCQRYKALAPNWYLELYED
jgi:hypothetical protein